MLDALFKPAGVAVLGASSKELSIGNVIVRNLVNYGFSGAVYPINPKAQEICGLRAYPRLADVTGPVDLAHVVLPAEQVPQAIAECGEKGVRVVIINSAGFKESGEAGERLQAEFLARAKRHGIRVFGPNCQGIINADPAFRAYCNFTNTFPRHGGISVAALSGGVGALIMQGLCDMGVGVRMYASNGNACDLSIPEIVDYWGNDPGTRAIVVYTEGFADARRFFSVAREAARKKPLLVMRAGRTESGAKAASSHTGALAGSGKGDDLMFEKAGILVFTNESELVRAAMAFDSQPIPRGNRVGIVTNTGGPAVIATDVLVGAGFEVPPLSPASVARLESSLLPQASLANPIDVVATAGPEHFRAALDVLLADDGIDCLLVNFVTPLFADTQAIAREIAAVSRMKRKPIVCNFMTDLTQERFRETQRILLDGGVPCYTYPGEAAGALGALLRYARLRDRDVGQPRQFADVDAPAAASIVEKARAAGRGILSATEVYGIFDAYRLPVAPWRVAGDAAAAAQAAAEIGFPVVVKVDCPAIDHKSDMGGVAVDLRDAEAVTEAVQKMHDRLSPFGELRYFVQKFLPGGQELIVGANEEGQHGHLVMFGLGGIHVEVFKDVRFQLAPLTPIEAREMLDGIGGAALLDGVRGKPGVAKDAVVDVILRVSQLLGDLPTIREMDINPLMAFPDRVFAVDGRIRIA
jgi:acetyltransferase